MKAYDVRRLAASLGYDVLRIKELGKFRWYVRSEINGMNILLGEDSDKAYEVLEDIKKMRGYS